MSNRTGRKHPPVATWFRKGKSGNPKGRPRGKTASAAPSAFDIVIDKALTVTQGGVPREVTVEEALQRQTYKAALAGSRPAWREVLKMIAQRERYLAKQPRPSGPLCELRTEEDPDNADTAMLILGIALPDPRQQPPDYPPGRLKLAPWAVQAALSRRRGGQRLTAKEIDEIRRCTHDADLLRWPRRATE